MSIRDWFKSEATWRDKATAFASQLPYGLDVFASGLGKVMNLEWDANEAVELVTFRAGEWQDKLLRFLV